MASTTTTYGYKLPSTGDSGANSGDGWAANINFNTQRLDAHSHNGTDSVILTAAASTGVAQNIDNTIHATDITLGWVLQADGQYKRRISMLPSSLKFDTHPASVRKYTSTSGGEDLWDVIHPTIEKFAIGTLDIYIDRVSGEPVNGSNILIKLVYVA